MGKQINSLIKHLNYKRTFNKIKNQKGEIVGIIKNNQILTESDTFIKDITSPLGSQNLHINKFHKSKLVLNVLDKRNNKIVAQVDNKHNVFDLHGMYIGTIPLSKLPFIYIGSISVLFIAMSLTILTLRHSASLVIDSKIYITDIMGNEVEENWDIFGEADTQKILYPNKKNVYRFNVVNDNDNDVTFTIVFEDENLENIPMKYRLSTIDGYLFGDKDTWVDIEEIIVKDLIIPAHSEVAFALQWKWISESDQNDTIIGNVDKAQYILHVAYVTSIYEKDQ